MILLTFVVVFLAVVLLVQQGRYYMSVEVAIGTGLTALVVQFTPRNQWSNLAVVILVDAVFIRIMYQWPQAVLPDLLFAMAITSFVVVRIRPKYGVLSFLITLAASVYPIYKVQHDLDGIMVVTVTGVSAIIVLQVSEVAQKFRLYRKLSIYDDLTNLHNMRYFRYKLHQYYRNPKIHELCLCIMDLDHFKRVNDKFGHREGDLVLKHAARVIETAAKPHVVSRYGGEEFVVLLPNTTLAEAKALAEYVRSSIAQARLCTLPITLSCGIASVNPSTTKPEELFDAADKAVYKAKEQRNCVCTAG